MTYEDDVIQDLHFYFNSLIIGSLYFYINISACPYSAKLNLPIKPLQRTSTRSSVEGLNQEIERIVLKTDSDIHTSKSDDFSKSCLITPEGHRAPLAEMLKQSRSRSVNTQTPQDFDSFSPSSGKYY